MLDDLKHFAASLALILTVVTSGSLAAETSNSPAPVYNWDPATYRAWEGTPFQAEPQANGEKGMRSRFTITGKSWNVFIAVPTGVLQGGQTYTATLGYEVITSPIFPGTFHMFARSKSLGQSQDVWVDWIGEPGDRGVVRLPMTLAPADDWTFSVGSKGPAALFIEHFAIHLGTGYETVSAQIPAPASLQVAEKPLVLATGSKAIVIDPPRPTSDLEVSTAEFAFTAERADVATVPELAVANAKALGLALAACRERGAARLIIPPGVYRLDAKESIRIEDVHDLVIDGQGAELIATRLMRTPLFQLSRCERVVVQDLVIDWDWTHSPIASLAVVEAVAEDRRSCTLRFPDLATTAMAPVLEVPWTHVWEVERESMRTIKSKVPYHIQVTKRELVDGNAIIATLSSPQALEVGQAFILRHLYYEMGVFKMADVHHLLFDTVTIHSMPGMGWIGRGDLDHLGLRKCRIARRAGSRHPLTTAADGFHILESQGNILIEDCEIVGTGDDCINIHDNCAQGVRKTGSTSVVLVDNPRWRMKVAEGDRLEFFKPDYSPIGLERIVRQVTYTGNDTVIDFTEALPEVLSPLAIVLNRRYGTTDVSIINNHFEHGRVMLSAEHVTITGNDFDHPYANALQLHTEIVLPHWSEGSGASNWVIRDNIFRGANQRGKFTGSVIHGAPVLPAGRTDYPIFHTVLIEGNRFVGSYGPIVSLAACADVIVRDNRIESATELVEANAHAGSIEVQRCKGVSVTGNTWVAGAGQRLPGVVYEAATTTNIQVTNNQFSAP